MATLTSGHIQVKKTSNGVWVDLPVPKKDGVTYEIQTVVDDARDASGTFIGSTVGQDKIKLNISYPPLDDDELRKILSVFDRERGGKFRVYVRFYDPRVGARTTRYMYVGDRSFDPWKIDGNGKPVKWMNCKCNLIEV